MTTDELMQMLEDWIINTFSAEGVASWWPTFCLIMGVFFVICLICSVCSWIRYWRMSPQERHQYKLEKLQLQQLQAQNANAAMMNYLMWQSFSHRNNQQSQIMHQNFQHQIDFVKEFRYHQDHPNSPWL